MRCQLLCILLTTLVAAPSRAGLDRWTAIGPNGGTVTALAFDPVNPNQAYAATASAGLFRSSDAGSHWAPAGAALNDVPASALVVLPGEIYVGGPDGVELSRDGGGHFSTLPGSPAQVTALGSGPGPQHFLLAAAEFGGAWRSDDGGATWRDINAGLEANPTQPAGIINAFLVHPRQPDLMWAGSEFGVYKSLDGGAHWQRASRGMGIAFVTSLAIDRQGTLYAGCQVDPANLAVVGLFVSRDLGETWSPSTRGLGARGVLALLADPAGFVWAGTQDSGVFRSTRRGDRWLPARNGLEGLAIAALAQTPGNPGTMLVGTGIAGYGQPLAEGPGVFKTTSGGAQWSLSNSGLTATTLKSLAAHPTASGTLYVLDPYRGLLRTRSAGAGWELLHTGVDPTETISRVATDSAEPSAVYAATGGFGPRFLLKSLDRGRSWSRLLDVPTDCTGPLEIEDGRLLTGGLHGNTCVSEDRGQTWRAGNPIGNGTPIALALAAADPTRAYSATFVWSPRPPPGPTFFRSDDDGATWRGMSAQSVSSGQSLAVDGGDANLLYAAAGSILRSRNAGATWDTLLAGAHAVILRLDPRAPQTLYAATLADGVPPLLVSDDAGATWSALTLGLAKLPVVDLAFDAADPFRIFAATSGGGVFELERSH